MSERSEAVPVHTVTVIGGGLMGTGIAHAVLKAGLKVVVVEAHEAARQRAGTAIPNAIQRDLTKQRISRAQADAQLAAFSWKVRSEERQGCLPLSGRPHPRGGSADR